jgi:thioesterase domain-containing protein
MTIERQIAGKLAADRRDSAQWLERTRREIEQAKLAEIAALEASAARDEEAAAKAAQDKATAILRQAQATADRLTALTDAQLAPLVRQRIATIAPGGTP